MVSAEELLPLVPKKGTLASPRTYIFKLIETTRGMKWKVNRRLSFPRINGSRSQVTWWCQCAIDSFSENPHKLEFTRMKDNIPRRETKTESSTDCMIPVLFDAGIPQYFQQKSIKQLYRYLLVQSTKTFVYIMIDQLNYTPLLQITKIKRTSWRTIFFDPPNTRQTYRGVNWFYFYQVFD